MSLGTSWEQPYYRTIDRHCLVRLILDGKRVCHSNPSKQERLIENDGLLEIFSGNLILFTVKVVSTDSEPAYWMRRIVFN